MLGAADRDERKAVGVVDVNRPRGSPVDARPAEEPKHHRLVRERREECPDCGLVVGSNGPDVQGRAVAEHDVGLAVAGIRSAAGRRCAHPIDFTRGLVVSCNAVVVHPPALHYERQPSRPTAARTMFMSWWSKSE